MHIFLVEDNPADAAMIMAAASDRQLEARFESCETCREARRRLADYAQPAAGRLPDLVVLDLRLPDGSGLDLLRYIRANGRLAALPVVALTGLPLPQDKMQALSAGADLLIKPNEFDGWLELVAGFAARR